MRKAGLWAWLVLGLAVGSNCTWLKFTRNDEIAKQKQKIVDLKHQIGLSHFLNGVFHEIFNEYSDAILEYEKTLQFDSSSVAVYNALA